MRNFAHTKLAKGHGFAAALPEPKNLSAQRSQPSELGILYSLKNRATRCSHGFLNPSWSGCRCNRRAEGKEKGGPRATARNGRYRRLAVGVSHRRSGAAVTLFSKRKEVIAINACEAPPGGILQRLYERTFTTAVLAQKDEYHAVLVLFLARHRSLNLQNDVTKNSSRSSTLNRPGPISIVAMCFALPCVM